MLPACNHAPEKPDDDNTSECADELNEANVNMHALALLHVRVCVRVWIINWRVLLISGDWRRVVDWRIPLLFG